ncbi:MAG: glycoside hydrolase family protein [Lachnospiraceae bacterium]|nr:glycoside hydrolase family protein [Lachnospiraceae bacterium]
MNKRISENGLALIRRFEGCRLTAYQDSAGVWTIGYGHTSGVSKGQTITQAQADACLRADCANAEKAVNRYMDTYHWNQNQFDALVSFTFNCGAGNLKTLLDGGTRSIAQISEKIPAYRKAGGRVLQGLVNRRAAEKSLFDTPVSPAESPAPSPTYLKPVCYLQTDPRWKAHNYSAKGEQKTIGSSGCGVTASAMVIATLKNPSVTPVTTAEWSMSHGYKALNQGTYYSYFVPQFSAYGILCERLNHSNLYGVTASAAHEKALCALQNGDWVIACMGKGNWTSAGHFILLYRCENGYVYINDPASTKETRIKNTWDLFAKQVKYMWVVRVVDGTVSPAVI